MALETPFIDKAIGWIAPRWALNRTRARIANELVIRHYEGASLGRRTQGWNRVGSDANTIHAGTTLAYLRNAARDLARNDRLIRQALRTIANHTVGWGIVAKPVPANPAVMQTWKAWAETAACDADGRNNLYGLQKLVMRSVARDGEIVVRRRIRRMEDGLPIPMQLQLLEADFLDTAKTGPTAGGGVVIQGKQFNAFGQLEGYWMFKAHPGAAVRLATTGTVSGAVFIPASELLHIYDSTDRAGQVRGPSWLAADLLPAKDLDEFKDAQRMKQKIAACLAVLTTDVDGQGTGLGTVDSAKTPEIDTLAPGMIVPVAPGRNVTVVEPPSVGDYGPYVTIEDRANAKGLGLSYEDYSGDYAQVNFSSARMSRLEHYDNVHDWRWNLLIPQFCDPVWAWAMEALAILGQVDAANRPIAQWTPPPMPMIEPDKEGLAIQRNVRTGITTTPDSLRERGIDPEDWLREQQDWNAKIDAAGIILDSDPRKTTQAGQFQSVPPTTPPDPNAPSRAELEQLLARMTALEAARQPITINAETRIEPGAVTVSTPAVQVDAPITVQPSPAPGVRVDAPVVHAPITIPPPVHVERVTTIERDKKTNLMKQTRTRDVPIPDKE